MIKLFITFQLLLVMVKEDGKRCQIPASMSLNYDSSELYLKLPDTTEVYPVTRITKFNEIYIKLDKGIVVIRPTSVYLFYYHSRRELFFNRNEEEWRLLKKKLMRRTKTNY